MNSYLPSSQVVSRLLLALLLMFALTSIACSKETPLQARSSDSAVTWAGTIYLEGGENIPVDLTTEQTADGIVYTFNYGPPRSCELTLEQAERRAQRLDLVVKITSGGYCDPLWKKHLFLDSKDEKHMDARVPTSEAGRWEEALLTRK